MIPSAKRPAGQLKSGQGAAAVAPVQLADASLDPSSRLILGEARKRGIEVEILDERAEFFRLRHGARSIVCRESLSELTTAVALSRCDDKRVTSQLLRAAGLRVPAQMEADAPARNEAFLHEFATLVVKPARGEQGRGVSVGIRGPEALTQAIVHAREFGGAVLLEQAVVGEDVRMVIIGFRLVAAAVRRPPRVTGTGRHTVAELIAEESKRRAAATSGASRIPFDAETRRCVREAGFELEDVPPRGVDIMVRKGANVHTGGTIHDVTSEISPHLVEVAERAARALDIPVVGLDLIVPSIHGQDYWIIEANERPGLANHEPQPTAARFIDLLFPSTA
jgi:GNAT-family acetyltransferase (TIGR03103 family)